MKAKPVAALTPADLASFPVWEFDIAHEALSGRDETWVVPVSSLPVDDLSNRLIASSLRLKNGQLMPGLLGNVALNDVLSTRQFLTVSIWHGDKWFHLARYFDHAYAIEGPTSLAALISLPVNQIFPIAYDISSSARGLADAVRGEVHSEPETRLSNRERMDLIFGRYTEK
jgi:hypothetical protein